MQYNKEERESYKLRINKLETKINSYVKYGYFNYKPLAYKEIKIVGYLIKDVSQTIDFTIETKYKEQYTIVVAIKDLDSYLENFITYKPREINIVQEKKTQSYQFENIKIGFTKEYSLFKFIKKSIPLNNPIFEYIDYTFNKFGNIIPIIVFKRNDGLYQILEGKKRFVHLMEEKQDVFYIDVTSLIKQDLNEKFIIDFDIITNKKSLKKSWDDMCRYYYPQYKGIEEFIKKNSIEQYIHKFHFILILEPNINKILRGEANFELDRVSGLWEEIKNYYNENEISRTTIGELKHTIYQYLKQTSKFYFKPLKQEQFKRGLDFKNFWFYPFIKEVECNPNDRKNIKSIHISCGNHYDLYLTQNMFELGYKIGKFKEEGLEYNIIREDINIQVDDIYSFLVENKDLFKELLNSKLCVDIEDIMEEIIEERKLIFEYNKE